MKKFKLIWPDKTNIVYGNDVVSAFFKAGYTLDDFLSLSTWIELSDVTVDKNGQKSKLPQSIKELLNK